MQQALEYMHVSHDVQLSPGRQLLLARRNVPDANLDDSAPDHLGRQPRSWRMPAKLPPHRLRSSPSSVGAQVIPPAQITAEAGAPPKSGAPLKPSFGLGGNGATQFAAASEPANPNAAGAPAKSPTGGTVVLEVEEGGIEVPSFVGKNLRAAIESAQDIGLDLDAVGSGVAREQSPQPGQARDESPLGIENSWCGLAGDQSVNVASEDQRPPLHKG